jgi:hypothetical protein
MPSPTGRNAERLHLPDGFPATRTSGGAYDEAGPNMPAGFLARCCRWMRERGFDAEELTQFIEYMDDGEVGEDEHATSRQNDLMEQAAGGHLQWRKDGPPIIKDKLPTYGKNHMPRNATQAHDAACKFAPGLANIKVGPLGW